jgi:hypothetical protein
MRPSRYKRPGAEGVGNLCWRQVGRCLMRPRSINLPRRFSPYVEQRRRVKPRSCRASMVKRPRIAFGHPGHPSATPPPPPAGRTNESLGAAAAASANLRRAQARGFRICAGFMGRRCRRHPRHVISDAFCSPAVVSPVILKLMPR